MFYRGKHVYQIKENVKSLNKIKPFHHENFYKKEKQASVVMTQSGQSSPDPQISAKIGIHSLFMAIEFFKVHLLIRRAHI